MNNGQTIYIVDDDDGIRESLSLLFETLGQNCESYDSAIDFLAAIKPNDTGCVILDIRMPKMSGLELQGKLRELNSTLPIIFITGHGDVPMAVEAMRGGALDFLRKPFREQDLIDRVNEALKHDLSLMQQNTDDKHIRTVVELLTEREYEVFIHVAEGKMNKVIAIDLSISERTVEAHRSQIMKKLDVRTLADLIRIKIRLEEVETREH
jgi:FixJ family two-component response regulator